MRALTAAAAAVAGGVAIGALARVAVQSAASRPVAASFVAFGMAACIGAAWDVGSDGRLVARWRRGAAVTGTAFVAGWSATAVAGGPTLVGAAAVVAGAAAAACGVASLLRTLARSPARAAFLGALVAAAPAATLFVVDPFVEWNGGGDGSLERAHLVIAASPLASIAADAGVDWQRSRWLYDGPAPGSPGLSVIGQYYPSRPTSPWTWGLAAAVLGFAALAAVRPGRTMTS